MGCGAGRALHTSDCRCRRPCLANAIGAKQYGPDWPPHRRYCTALLGYKGQISKAVGKDAEVPDTNETFGKQVQQESAQELSERQGHQLRLVVVGRVAPVVGDGDATSVTTQILEHRFGATEGWFRVDHAKNIEIAPDIHLIALVSAKPGMLQIRELSLAINTPDGMVIVVGCSHPGMDKIVESATAIHPAYSLDR